MGVFPMMLCFLFFIISALPNPNTLVCNEREKNALLTFKQALYDPAHRLSSWSIQHHQDCCQWDGVSCHNITGRVLKLDLHNPCSDYSNISCDEFELGGKVSPALLQLEFLNYLDLRHNNFGGIPIPSFLGSMRSLIHLNLSYASFGGLIPPQLGNLSNLHSLHLGGAYYNDEPPPPLYVENLKWISRLSSLEDLYMYHVDLHSAVDWLESINMLSSLSELDLRYCNLDDMNPSLESVNFTSLTSLDLSDNHLHHEMPPWVFNLPGLNYLDLSYNQLRGQIPEYVGQLKHLEMLYIEGNRLNGTLPSGLGLLSNLEVLYIGNNSLEGTISEVHFNKLSKLRLLDISHSPSLDFNVDSSWVPPFQLYELWMGSCHMGPTFPMWLQTQTALWYLDVSNSGIVDTAPTWFWKWASRLEYIADLSNNQIYGNLSGVLLNNTSIDLSSNCFEGELPRLSSNVFLLKMANNSFSGSISHFLCQKLNGETQLTVLDMSTNHLTGEIPDCLKDWRSLTHLNLGHNYLSGKIPDSMASLFKLEALHLNNNCLFGNIPPSLRNCTSLGLLDLGGNKFSGNIPNWLGERTALIVLILGSNGFTGNIPSQICQLSSLIVLDFSNNNLFSTIPKCFNNFTSMTTSTKYDDFSALEYSYYEQDYENVMLVIKGRESEYKSILKHVRTIDLSSNNLSGSIPDEISSLSTLQSLNLSFNHLMGMIPEKIGSMKLLECLDLSRNHISGEIPQSMRDLTFLNNLNLSYNNLSGRIPSSTQLQSFDTSSYIDNVELCGAPLTNNCTRDEELEGMSTLDEIEKGHYEIKWFYVGMVFGFIMGFWGVCGPLILKRSWRHAYFQFAYHVTDWVLMAIMMKWKWLQNIVKRET